MSIDDTFTNDTGDTHEPSAASPPPLDEAPEESFAERQYREAVEHRDGLVALIKAADENANAKIKEQADMAKSRRPELAKAERAVAALERLLPDD